MIKYRVWNERFKEYRGSGNQVHYGKEIWGIEGDDYSKIELFTGLQDKNEKDIFVGDILEFTDLAEGGSFEKRIFRYVIKSLTVIEDFEESDLKTFWKIVGNINENKELLK